MSRVILSNITISVSDDVYNLDLNIIRKFGNDYFAKCKNRPFEIFQVTDEVIDQLILEAASCAKDNIDTEDFDDALEDIKVMMNLCELRDSNINKVKLW